MFNAISNRLWNMKKREIVSAYHFRLMLLRDHPLEYPEDCFEKNHKLLEAVLLIKMGILDLETQPSKLLTMNMGGDVLNILTKFLLLTYSSHNMLS